MGTNSKTLIIGNGIAGTTAARHIRKNSDQRIKIISEETKYFFSRTALMYVYMGHMRKQDIQPYEPDFWEKNSIELEQERVSSINFEDQFIVYQSGRTEKYDQLILATGSVPNKFGWPGENAINVQGLYSMQDLDTLEEISPSCQQAVIVGGGLIGIELAEMLLTRGISVHFLVRESHFWNNVLPKVDSELIMNHLKHHKGLTMHYNTELAEIVTDEHNRASAVITKTGERIACDFVGLTAGVRPNIDFLKTSPLDIDRGILVDDYLQTNQPHVFAIGDCAQLRNPQTGRKALEQVWYTGRLMGETVAQTVVGQPTKYRPGHWFNSAKFFDIEYQTYGIVPAQLEATQDEFIWQHPTEELLLHFVFEKNTWKFIGINCFGIRMRHDLFDYWLNKNVTIHTVLERLQEANFDPEFYKKHEKSVIDQFNATFKQCAQLNQKTWWQNLLKA